MVHESLPAGYVEFISARTKAALAYKKSQGLRTGHVPYGKRLAADGKHLEDNPAELEAVELMRAAKEARARLGEELAAVRSKIAALKKQPKPSQAEMRRLLAQELELGKAYRANGSRALARTLSANPSRYPARGAKGWSAQLVEQVLKRL
jgi:DNA invertase Pin-like site-specific DNA recombinase